MTHSAVLVSGVPPCFPYSHMTAHHALFRLGATFPRIPPSQTLPCVSLIASVTLLIPPSLTNLVIYGKLSGQTVKTQLWRQPFGNAVYISQHVSVILNLSLRLCPCLNVSLNTTPSLCLHPLFSAPLCVYRLVAKPCAHILQIQAGVPRQAQPNAVLERLYQSKTVHKACVCSVVHSMLVYTFGVVALGHTHNDTLSKYLMFCDSIPIGIVVFQAGSLKKKVRHSIILFCIFLLSVQTRGSLREPQSNWTGMWGKYSGGSASDGTKTDPVCRKSFVRACRLTATSLHFLPEGESWMRWSSNVHLSYPNDIQWFLFKCSSGGNPILCLSV